jgi:hypothetical protein
MIGKAGSTDWTGLATFITALGATLVSIIGAFAALRANAKVSTPENVPPIGEIAANVAAAVTTPPDSPPLGEVVASTSDTLDHVHEVVCNGTTSEPAGEGARP